MTNLPIPVILFRTLTQPFASDPFHLLLAQGPYEEKSIPVLNETYVVEELTRIVERGPDGWEGVIIMSRRGAEGWVQATKLFNDARGDYDPSGFEGDHPEVTEEGREELENGGGKFESPSEPSESFKSTHRQFSHCSRFRHPFIPIHRNSRLVNNSSLHGWLVRTGHSHPRIPPRPSQTQYFQYFTHRKIRCRPRSHPLDTSASRKLVQVLPYPQR